MHIRHGTGNSRQINITKTCQPSFEQPCITKVHQDGRFIKVEVPDYTPTTLQIRENVATGISTISPLRIIYCQHDHEHYNINKLVLSGVTRKSPEGSNNTF